MDRTLFERRFRDGAAHARDFARRFIAETLPDEMVFRVRLNASYDGNPLHADERTYPEESSAELARQLQQCSASEVVEVLWRDGAVPEWVNLSVIGETGAATLIEVLSCGRFTANQELLYHAQEGRPPFHILGPTLPVGYQEGDQFSIYNRAECWTRQELTHLAQHRAKVWSLNLYGPEFDDAYLAELPDFARLEILELKASPIRGPALSMVRQLPNLRQLRVYFDHNDSFSIDALATSRRLQGLSLYRLPAGPWGFGGLAAKAPALYSLTIESQHVIVLDAHWSRPLERLSIRGKRIEGDPDFAQVSSLSLHLSEADDAHVTQLLARMRTVTDLGLRGTLVGDELVESLLRRWSLRYLDVVNTQVSDDCVRRITAAYPKLRMHPRLKV